MRYVTAAEMKTIDRMAIEKYGIPASLLMENAGEAVTEEILKSVRSGYALVVSGYGNNGGDGFVIARRLIKNGFGVSVFLAGRPKPFSRETGDNFKALLDFGATPIAVYDLNNAKRAFDALPRCDIIVDALFGTGIKGRLDDFYIGLMDMINFAGAAAISVDLPSGLDADTGEPCPTAVRASKTVTLAFPKAGFKNPKSVAYTGEIIIADIGIPEAAVRDVIGTAEDRAN